jgi:hypothetical protein
LDVVEAGWAGSTGKRDPPEFRTFPRMPVAAPIEPPGLARSRGGVPIGPASGRRGTTDVPAATCFPSSERGNL